MSRRSVCPHDCPDTCGFLFRSKMASTPQRLSDLGGGATFFSTAVEVERVAAAAGADL